MGCFWGWRDNNSYADTTITASDGTSYKYGTVFTEKTTKGEGIACSSYANCYIGCSCNTSNGWYSTCQGSDCKSATDNHYTGVNSLSAGKSISDVGSISASGANSGISASAAAAKSDLKTASAAGNYTATAASAGLKTASATAAATGATSGISTMASGATTCYKKKTCSEGGYFDSVPADQKCSSKSYNGYSCYTGCSYKTCSDYGYNSSIPSGKNCTTVYPRSGLTCYKDCKDDYFDFSVYTSGSTNNGSVVGMTTTVTITGSGYNKTIKQTTKTAGDYFSFSGIPSGSYTVEGQTTMQVKNGNGPGLFCAHNLGSTFEVTKKVTIGSGGSRSVTLAFTCNTSSGGGSIIGGCPYDNNCRDSAEPKPMIIRGQKCCCPQDYSTSETINRCDCCVSEIL